MEGLAGFGDDDDGAGGGGVESVRVGGGDVDVGQNTSTPRRAVGSRLMTAPDNPLVAARAARLHALRLVAVQRTMSLQLHAPTHTRSRWPNGLERSPGFHQGPVDQH